jgi:predicted dehydrogenase
MSEVRLCMIGAGHHASRLVYSCFPFLRNAQVVANADLEIERAELIARRYGIERSYSDYRQMIETEKPDGVLTCVGADFHARTAIELLESGYHVYTEKPPALNLEQCRAIQKAQRQSGKVYMTAFKKRFAPAYQKTKAVIESEEFSEPDLLTITRTSGNWREGADSVNDYLRENAIHVVDLAAYLFGPVRSVTATAHSVATAAITLEFARGGIGTLAVTDRMSYARGWEIVTVIGSTGVCIQVDNSVEMNAWKFDQPIAAHKPEFVAGTSLSSIEQGFIGEIQAFVDAIQSGSQPDANIETTTHTMAILKAIAQSLASGQRAEVETTQ